MVYLRSVKGYTRLDCIHDKDIRQELNITHIIKILIATGNSGENM